MARGWESKAVADQIEEGNQPRGPQAPELTPEETTEAGTIGFTSLVAVKIAGST